MSNSRRPGLQVPSFDPLDDTVDLAGSIRREIAEETGLDPGLYEAEEGWYCVPHGALIAQGAQRQRERGRPASVMRVKCRVKSMPGRPYASAAANAGSSMSLGRSSAVKGLWRPAPPRHTRRRASLALADRSR